MSDSTPVNDQILAAVRALTEHSGDDSGEFVINLARQALAQAVVMAVQNAVAAQQRNYLLRQAVTTAVVKQALEAPADETLKIVEPHLSGDDIVETLRQLKNLLEEMEPKTP